MRVCIRNVNDKNEECVVIECVEISPEVESIRSYALAKGTMLTGSAGEQIFQFELSDVFYFEAVDERVFAYTKANVYELKIRLYQLEDAYSDRHFIRCSKSFVINLMRLDSISPALNGRFYANMKNGEKIIISRQYVSALKNIVFGGKHNGF
ncbi:LytTR family DNA-binding domain-containing protein [Gudongella oleilytica]|jgi:DNA-binding LytR/AlgR family response regulator|uniref:LytTR family DNA-binding domain-containing protein n=1 Tax=Gudongella oleilytica TaxID=1582259 RepID=UPI000EEDDEFF|nr:LytTR family DNA-binding domain-containing protein [Gudongella oleilytica]MDY0257420.1 LytTR family DNA-binding domain-containing protein [Gudongella oleilytica]HCO18691.1 histidine kinase [Tissierellales bacterium]